MTVPNNWNFPLHIRDHGANDPKSQEAYLRELIFDLQRMYEVVADGINGDIRTDAGAQQSEWTPVLKGTTVAGTFTYSSQTGYVLRKGLFVDVWFDVTWTSSGSASGNLYLELPYEVADSSDNPFVGVVQPSNLTYTAGTYVTVNAIPNTYRAELFCVGSGIAATNQLITTSGRIAGHLRYPGKRDE